MTTLDPASQNLAIDTSICLHRSDLPVQSIALRDGVVVSGQVLNRRDDGSIRSAIVTLAAQACVTVPAGGGTIQVFILHGTLEIDGIAIGSNGFAALPGRSDHALVARTDVSAIFICDVPASGDCPEPVYLPDCMTIEPFVPTIDGKLLVGFERRVLWFDPRTGADTRLLKVPAGFAGGGPNWHPVNEEIFCLDGDIQPDETRPMRAGSYLLNPARSIHGFDERTDGGCILLEWHDGPWALTSAPGTVRP